MTGQEEALEVWSNTRFKTQLKILKILLEMTPHPTIGNTLRTCAADWMTIAPGYKVRYMLPLLEEVVPGSGRIPSAWRLKVSMEELHDALNIPKENNMTKKKPAPRPKPYPKPAPNPYVIP